MLSPGNDSWYVMSIREDSAVCMPKNVHCSLKIVEIQDIFNYLKDFHKYTSSQSYVPFSVSVRK